MPADVFSEHVTVEFEDFTIKVSGCGNCSGSIYSTQAFQRDGVGGSLYHANRSDCEKYQFRTIDSKLIVDWFDVYRVPDMVESV